MIQKKIEAKRNKKSRREGERSRIWREIDSVGDIPQETVS
jgi:hypothetical protein